MKDRPQIHLDRLKSAIACSPIVVPAEPVLCVRHPLPTGFDEADIAVLEWLAAEARRAARLFRPI